MFGASTTLSAPPPVALGSDKSLKTSRGLLCKCIGDVGIICYKCVNRWRIKGFFFSSVFPPLTAAQTYMEVAHLYTTSTGWTSYETLFIKCTIVLMYIQENHLSDEIILGIAYWLKDETFCLINMMNHVTAGPFLQLRMYEATFKTSRFYIFAFYFSTLLMVTDTKFWWKKKKNEKRGWKSSPSFQMTDRAVVHFY